jgi:hypothetical protein
MNCPPEAPLKSFGGPEKMLKRSESGSRPALAAGRKNG